MAKAWKGFFCCDARGPCFACQLMPDSPFRLQDGETPLDVCGKRNADARKLITALLKGEDGGDIGREEDSDWETDESGEDDEE